MSEPLWQPRTDRGARLLGAGFLIGGAALLAYQASVIVDAVAAGAPNVTWFMAAVALGAMGVLLGGYWLTHGLAGYTAIRAVQQDRRRMRMVSIVVAVVTVALVVLMLGARWLPRADDGTGRP